MGGIFISYRREDSSSVTGRLYDRLAAHFGASKVFRDIYDMKPGVDFAHAIADTIAATDVLLAVIGRRWVDCRDGNGRRRIDDPADWVGLEISTALQRGSVVVPVLVEDAKLPSAAELPPSVQGIARRQSIDLTDKRWDYDVGELIKVLEERVPLDTAPVVPPPPALRREGPQWVARWRVPLATGLVTVLAAALLVVLNRSDSGNGPSTTTAAGQPVVSVTSTPPTSTTQTSLGPSNVPPGFSEFATKTADSGPRDITLGPDGALWFTAPKVSKVGRITAAGAVTEFAVPTRPHSIATGPDGALWYTSENRIGRMTTTGEVKEFPTPTTASNPMGRPTMDAGLTSITAGPDGALWFTESGADKIGRITTAGAVTEYPLPGIASRHDSPAGITVGPDKALWFTEQLGGKIGRIDPTTRDITEYPVPVSSGLVGMANVVAGPDQALWFVETGRITRMTPKGEITNRYDAPFATTGGGEVIAVGRDGLWITENRVNRIARVTTSGQITEFPIPAAGARVADLVVDNAGDLWFTEENTSKIGRLHVS